MKYSLYWHLSSKSNSTSNFKLSQEFIFYNDTIFELVVVYMHSMFVTQMDKQVHLRSLDCKWEKHKRRQKVHETYVWSMYFVYTLGVRQLVYKNKAPYWWQDWLLTHMVKPLVALEAATSKLGLPSPKTKPPFSPSLKEWSLSLLGPHVACTELYTFSPVFL